MKNQRTCIACRQTKEKTELFRVEKQSNGEICIAEKQNGRGAYICKDEACIKKAQKTHALNRAFKCEVADEIYQNLLSEIK